MTAPTEAGALHLDIRVKRFFDGVVCTTTAGEVIAETLEGAASQFIARRPYCASWSLQGPRGRYHSPNACTRYLRILSSRRATASTRESAEREAAKLWNWWLAVDQESGLRLDESPKTIPATEAQP